MNINKFNLTLLTDLIDEIHDRYFNLDEVTYDERNLEWRLFFSDSRKGPFERILKITGVVEYKCRDTERILIYDMNKIVIDINKGIIILKCNVPLDIKLYVNNNFQIYVE